MYTPHFYEVEDPVRVADFVGQHDFGTLVIADKGVPVASHLLMHLEMASDGSWLVSGHMARANPLWRAFDPLKEVLLIFGGPNAYISPTWYSQLNVPTWNYMAVHLYGLPRAIDGGAELRDILSKLVKRYEAKTDYRMESLPPDFVEKQLKGVVGFEIRVTRTEASFKLSQNRNAEDHANVIRQLDRRGDEQSIAIASEMKKNKKAD
jgi:transcriptional regulator